MLNNGIQLCPTYPETGLATSRVRTLGSTLTTVGVAVIIAFSTASGITGYSLLNQSSISGSKNFYVFDDNEICLDGSISVYNGIISNKGTDTMKAGVRPTQMKNFERLDSFLNLKRNWNQNDAEPISEKLVSQAKGLLPVLLVQPEIFPTANGTIQFEYDNSVGDHFDFEMYADGKAEYFWEYKNGAIREEIQELDIGLINEAIYELYGD